MDLPGSGSFGSRLPGPSAWTLTKTLTVRGLVASLALVTGDQISVTKPLAEKADKRHDFGRCA